MLARAAAARHAKLRPRERSVQEGRDELIDRAAAKPDHPDAGENKHVFQRRRDRAADEDVGPKSQKLGDSERTIRRAQTPLLAPDFPFVFDID